MALLRGKHIRKRLTQIWQQFREDDGYTLVEILVVLAIIAMIMGMVGPRVIAYLSESKVKTARIQITNLKAAVDLYYLDTGSYPNMAEGLEALVNKPQDVSSWNGPYLEIGAVPTDPWGKAYVYRMPGKIGPYMILSLGADGQEGGTGDNSDITNEQR